MTSIGSMPDVLTAYRIRSSPTFGRAVTPVEATSPASHRLPARCRERPTACVAAVQARPGAGSPDLLRGPRRGLRCASRQR